jgi:hypothetical protein
VALDPDAAWAIAIRDSLNSDALVPVVLQGIDNAKKTSKTGVPGCGRRTGQPGARRISSASHQETGIEYEGI